MSEPPFRLVDVGDRRVLTVDGRDQRQLPGIYASADVFVLASDCAGNRSLVADGETGLVFDPMKPKQPAARLDRVFREPGLAGRPTRAAREQILARYELRVLVEREIELLRQVGGGRG